MLGSDTKLLPFPPYTPRLSCRRRLLEAWNPPNAVPTTLPVPIWPTAGCRITPASPSPTLFPCAETPPTGKSGVIHGQDVGARYARVCVRKHADTCRKGGGGGTDLHPGQCCPRSSRFPNFTGSQRICRPIDCVLPSFVTPGHETRFPCLSGRASEVPLT